MLRQRRKRNHEASGNSRAIKVKISFFHLLGRSTGSDTPQTELVRMQNIILNTGTAKADEVRANRGFWECSEKVRQKVLMPELKASIFSHVS
jgi:hypothetical protein